jgi:4-hydroxy-3-polyprenylbenzoate decarboxylase
MLLPRHVLRRIAAHPEIETVHLVVSAGASQVLRHELGPEQTGAADLADAAELSPDARAKVQVHRDNELDAPIASGSYRLTGSVVLPCSAGTLGALATGSARTLVHRAGAVALKERWPLVLGFRETPYSLVHIENRSPPSTSAARTSAASSTTTPCASSTPSASASRGSRGCGGGEARIGYNFLP